MGCLIRSLFQDEKARYDRDPAHRCEFCRWVDVRPLPLRPMVIALGCLAPKTCYGQAARGGHCCGFEREPGSGDETSPTRG